MTAVLGHMAAIVWSAAAASGSLVSKCGTMKGSTRVAVEISMDFKTPVYHNRHTYISGPGMFSDMGLFCKSNGSILLIFEPSSHD